MAQESDPTYDPEPEHAGSVKMMIVSGAGCHARGKRSTLRSTDCAYLSEINLTTLENR